MLDFCHSDGHFRHREPLFRQMSPFKVFVYGRYSINFAKKMPLFMERKEKNIYVSPSVVVHIVQMENPVLNASMPEGTIHNYIFDGNEWEDLI